MNDNDPFVTVLASCDCATKKNMSLAANSGPATSDPDAARSWFNELCQKGATGWAQFSDMNVWVDNGKPKKTSEDNVPTPIGIMLAAELHIAAGDESHHLRHDGEKWIAMKITLKEEAGAFLETRTLLHSDKTSKLTYEVAWTAKDGSPLRPTTFRFVSSTT